MMLESRSVYFAIIYTEMELQGIKGFRCCNVYSMLDIFYLSINLYYNLLNNKIYTSIYFW